MTYPIKCHIRAEGGTTRVDVYDDIGESFFGGEGVTAKNFGSEIARAKGPLDVHINSGGGNVADGTAIATAIRAYKGRKRTIVDGMAASIASIIMQAGDERIVEPGAMVMIHDAWSPEPVGNPANGRRALEAVEKHSQNLAEQYAKRAGGTADYWRGIMQDETWFTAEEAVAAGLADRVGIGSAALPANLDLAAIHAVPGRIVASMRALPVIAPGAPVPPAPGAAVADAAPVELVASADGAPCCPNCGTKILAAGKKSGGKKPKGDKPLGDGWVIGPDGTPRFDPDGDGDDDATPEGDTDHDYFDEDGKQIKPIPPCPDMPDKKAKGKKAGEILNATVDTTPWDASKAWHNGAQADNPSAFYAAICAGKKAGDPDTQAGWALPYRYTPDSPPNAAGVRNALARLTQTQGLINKAEAQKKLEGLMHEINPDHESSENHIDTGLLSAVLTQALRGGTK